ncbi:hypothetical protein FQZ97_663520 [compost metagenome]
MGRVPHRLVQQRDVEAAQRIARRIVATHRHWSTANCLDVMQEAQFLQHKAGIGPERHASPHGRRPCPALVYTGAVPLLAQCKRHAQARNAAAKYPNFHAETLLVHAAPAPRRRRFVEREGILDFTDHDN